MQHFNHKIQLLLCGITLLIACAGFAHADETMTNGTVTTQPSNLPEQTTDNIPVWDLNTANALELSSIKGIGFKKAQAIVTYRETYGDFTNIEQITLVKGIGKKMLARMQSSITVNTKPERSEKSSLQGKP
ncbi:MAG: ComEA family DNA-binding protein [Glaciecola sp.]|jgi:competence protein ComEA|nr:ComEA family DNA-binding protein [Glaciecola sp.]MDG1816337.1 ComEA family DNA-binding protein [Glaciecola sp.]MDG2100249.1 ComEA family DNA-binding protein [Glaciecola sp.]